MTFWRQGSNDSLNDKLVRPRSSNSYWDRKPQSPANEDIGTKLKDAQDVFTDVPEKLADDIDLALDDTKDEITKAVDEIFPETPKASDMELPELPSLEADLDNDLANDDEDLLAPPSLDDIEALDETSLESLSLDQSEEDDLSDDEYDDELPEVPPILLDEASESIEGLSDTEIENDDVKDLETSNLESLDIEIPELEDIELTSESSELGKMPPVIPSSGSASGNAAHKYDEEEFQANDTSSDSESETVAVPEAVSDLEEIDTKRSDDKSSNEDNGSGQVIAFPPNQSRSDEAQNDRLTDEERLAVSLSSSAAITEQATEKAPHFTARVTKPKSESPIVTPRRTEASYYDNGEQVYEPGLDDDDGYYVPSHDSDESGRRIALYLAGAASISAICGAVYLMLPKGSDEGNGLTTAGTTVAPTLPGNIADDTKTADNSTVAASDTDTAAITGSSALSDLAAANTEELDATVTEPISDLFASKTETEKPEASISEIETRSLSPNTTTLSSPDLKSPDVSTPQVTEDAPRLTLSESKKTVEVVETVTKPEPKALTPQDLQTPTFSTPQTAPKRAKRKLFANNSSTETAPPKATSESRFRAPKILRSNTPKAVAPTVTNVGERIYDGVLRAGSMPQTIIDSLFAQGAYLASKEQKQFAYNIRHAAKTTPDGEVNSITTQNGTRVDLHFLTTQNEVRPTFVTRSDKMEPLPSYMLMKDDWVRTTDTTKLYAAATQYDQRVLKNLPIGTSLERMGSVTDSNGEQWSLVGQKGVAIGFVPSLDLTSISNTGIASVTPYTTTISDRVIERIDVSAPCRDYTMSIGGTGSMHSACLTPEGDWMTKEAANSGLSYAIAPPTTTTVSTTAPITTSPITTAPIRSSESIFNSGQLASSSSALSADAEAILFQPQTLRRDARHGMGSASKRISSLFDGNAQPKAIPISSPEGQIGRLSIPVDHPSQAITPPRSNDVTLTTSLVQLDKQVRLMNAPAGSVVPEAETVMRGDILEAISVSTTPTGESWTLVGSNGVGYGYVLTDYTSSSSASSVTYDGFNSATSLEETATKASMETADYVAAAPECQTATFSTGSETGVLKACLQPNGMWTAEIVPNNSYATQTTVSVSDPMNTTQLF